MFKFIILFYKIYASLCFSKSQKPFRVYSVFKWGFICVSCYVVFAKEAGKLKAASIIVEQSKPWLAYTTNRLIVLEFCVIDKLSMLN